MTETCKFCRQPGSSTLGSGKLEVRVCARHDKIARETGKELVHTAARMAGAALEKKAPLLFETGKAVFVALRLASEKDADVEADLKGTHFR